MKRLLAIILCLSCLSVKAVVYQPFYLTPAVPVVSPTNSLTFLNNFQDVVYPTNYTNPFVAFNSITDEIAGAVWTNLAAATHSCSNGVFGFLPYFNSGTVLSNPSPPTLTTATPWTFGARIRPTVNATINTTLFGASSGTPFLGVTTNGAFFTLFNGVQVTNNVPLTNVEGAFHTYIFTYDGSNPVKLSVDGADSGFTWGTPTASIILGMYGGNGASAILPAETQAFFGAVGTNLSGAQQTNLCVYLITNGFHYSMTNVLLDSRLTEGSGTNTTESSTNALSGVIKFGTNFAWTTGPAAGMGAVRFFKNTGQFISINWLNSSNIVIGSAAAELGSNYLINGWSKFDPLFGGTLTLMACQWNGTGFTGSGTGSGVGQETLNQSIKGGVQNASGFAEGFNKNVTDTLNWHNYQVVWDFPLHQIITFVDGRFAGLLAGGASGTWWTPIFTGTNNICFGGSDANAGDCGPFTVADTSYFAGYPPLKTLYWRFTLPDAYPYIGYKQ